MARMLRLGVLAILASGIAAAVAFALSGRESLFHR